jgi:hypothetical protein
MQCMNETQLFQECVKNTGGDTAPCQAYMDMMMKCKARKPPPCSPDVFTLLTSACAACAVCASLVIHDAAPCLEEEKPGCHLQGLGFWL